MRVLRRDQIRKTERDCLPRMLLKWIICSTQKESQSRFSEAQEQWAALKDIPGFLGQVGGWSSKHPLQAGILSCWQDEASYQHFMHHLHDGIFQQSQQKETYTSISVTLFKIATMLLLHNRHPRQRPFK